MSRKQPSYTAISPQSLTDRLNVGGLSRFGAREVGSSSGAVEHESNCHPLVRGTGSRIPRCHHTPRGGCVWTPKRRTKMRRLNVGQKSVESWHGIPKWWNHIPKITAKSSDGRCREDVAWSMGERGRDAALPAAV